MADENIEDSTDESLVENFEDTNPYRHIEEANEENYRAELNK